MKAVRKILKLFVVKKEERVIAMAAVTYSLVLNLLLLLRYSEQFMLVLDDYRTFFVEHFHISGFDPVSYMVVSDWDAWYNVYRHPLLAFMEYPLFLINQLLILLTGRNMTIFLLAVCVMFLSFYSVLFLYRIFREILMMSRWDSRLLTALTFSFAYTMLACMVPDHFIFSMFLLLLTLYLVGRLLKEGREMTIELSILLFLLTAGVSLNNGLKVFAAALFANGKRFFTIRYMLLAIVVPMGVMWGSARLIDEVFVQPHVRAKNELKKAASAKAREQYVAEVKASGVSDSATIYAEVKKRMKKRTYDMWKERQKTPARKHSGKPIASGEFVQWTDVTTPRLPSIVENLFGEPVQLHQDYLLQDVLNTERPVIVKYRWFWNYFMEAVVAILFFCGVWCGRNSRFLWIGLSWFLMDMSLHIGLGFGINEIYIMSPQWMFVFTVSMGYLLRSLSGRSLMAVRITILLTTLWLFVYNGSLLVQYMMT